MMSLEDVKEAALLARVVERAQVYVRDARVSSTVLQRLLVASGATHLHDAVHRHLSLRGTEIHDQACADGYPTHTSENGRSPSAGDLPDSTEHGSRKEYALTQARKLLRSDRRYGASPSRLLTQFEEIGLSLIMNDSDQRLAPGAIRMLTGEARAAADAMIIHNQKLVWSIVRTYNVQGMEDDDLFQHGCAGLLRAVELFDPRQGNKFSTYATHWIRQAITRGIAYDSRAIRIPVHMHERIARVRKELRSRQVGFEKAPIQEIALATGLSPSAVADCIRLMPGVASLDEPIGAATETTLGDMVSYPVILDPEKVVIRDSYAESVVDTLAILDERSKKILRMRHGLDQDESMTLDQIGVHFGLTRERIRQIESKALSRVRDALAR